MTMLVLTRFVVTIKNAECQEGAITVSSKRSFSQRGKIIHVVESRPVLFIVACQEEVDVIRGLQNRK